MATASGIRAGRAYIELSLSDGKFAAGLKNAERRLTNLGTGIAKFGAKLTGLGASLAGPILLFGKEFSQFGDDIQKAAIRTGLTAEAVSELGFAAAQSGTDLAAMEAGIRGMQRSLLSAAQGSKEAADSLAEIGLSIADLQGLDTDTQFTKIAEGLSQIENDSQRAGVAMRIFGKSGSQLLPLLQDGAKGIQLLRDEAKQLGLSITTDDANRAAELNDAIGRFTSTFKAARVQIGAAIAGVLTPFLTSTAKIVANLIEWSRQNRGLIATVFLIGTGVAAAGTALVALGGAITLAGIGIGGLASALGVLGTVIGALLSPIGLVSAGVVALGAVAIKAFGGIAPIIDYLKGKFGELSGRFGEAIDVIRSALTSGDLATAGEVLWATLQVVWAKGVLLLNQQWASWKNYFTGLAIDATSTVAGIFVKATTGFYDIWIRSFDFIKDAFDLVVTGIANGFLLLGEVVLGVLSKIQSGLDYVFGTNFAQSIDKATQKLEELRQSANESFIQRVGDRDTARKDRLDQLQRDQQGTLAELEKERQRKQAALSQADTSAVDEAQRKLDAAFAAYAKTVDEAKQKQADVNQQQQQPAVDFAGLTEGLADAAAKTPSRQAVFGGVRAEGVFGGLGSDQLEISKKQLEEVKKSTKELQALNKSVAAGGLAFTG